MQNTSSHLVQQLPKYGGKILFLGEGNFSFCLALMRKVSKDLEREESGSVNAVEFIATSLDSAEEVVAKYPEFLSVKKKIEALQRKMAKRQVYLNCKILHNIDATNIKQSLQAQGVAEEQVRFNRIIFNHPHSGSEDLRKNNALVAHFLHNASEVLSEEPSADIHFMLLRAQFERWRIFSSINSSQKKLRIVSCTPLNRELYELGFESRRHQSGGSFQNTRVSNTFAQEEISQSWNFVVRRDSADSLTLDQILQKISDYKEQVEFLSCNLCEKKFLRIENLNVHVREKHSKNIPHNITSQMTASTEVVNLEEQKADAVTLFQDSIAYSNQQQQLQNTTSNINSSMKPEWAGVKLLMEENRLNQEQVVCEICRQLFDSVLECEAHLEWLRPKLIQFTCDNCSKKFNSERSLQQHLQVCSN